MNMQIDEIYDRASSMFRYLSTSYREKNTE